MVFKYVKFFIVLTFISCSSKDTSPQYIDGDDLIPPSPSIKSYFTIHGEDVDKDGVRDDIELYINKTFNDSNVRKAFKSDAKTFGSFMKSTDTEEINKLFVEAIDTTICLGVFTHTVENYGTSKILEWRERLLNNRWRMKNYEKQGKIVRAGIYSWGGSGILSKLKRCRFKFTDLHITLQPYLNSDYKYGMSNDEIREFESLMKI